LCCEFSVTYNAISLERGSWSCSSGLKGISEGNDGVKGVTALAGSIWSAEVGDKLSSGTAFSWLSPVVNHDLGNIISDQRDEKRKNVQAYHTSIQITERGDIPHGTNEIFFPDRPVSSKPGLGFALSPV
jgi:hypothetical protein